MNTRNHKTNTPHARRHEAAGRSHARPDRLYRPSATACQRTQASLFGERMPGIEWVVVSILVVCLTALAEINRREDAARLARHQQTQVQNQNEYQAPDGFGPLLSHGGEHEQHKYSP